MHGLVTSLPESAAQGLNTRCSAIIANRLFTSRQRHRSPHCESKLPFSEYRFTNLSRSMIARIHWTSARFSNSCRTEARTMCQSSRRLVVQYHDSFKKTDSMTSSDSTMVECLQGVSTSLDGSNICTIGIESIPYLLIILSKRTFGVRTLNKYTSNTVKFRFKVSLECLYSIIQALPYSVFP